MNFEIQRPGQAESVSAYDFASRVSDYAEFLVQRADCRLASDEIQAIRQIAARVYDSAGARAGRLRLNGQQAVEWIRDYRNQHGCSLREAKAEWDKRANQPQPKQDRLEE